MDDDKTKTVVVQIGNSDDRLSQREWSVFCSCIQDIVDIYGTETHFSGGSLPNAPWQNFCWVVNVPQASVDILLDEISDQRMAFRQSSIAVIVGDTQFI